jgi:hypothetical protein
MTSSCASSLLLASVYVILASNLNLIIVGLSSFDPIWPTGRAFWH